MINVRHLVEQPKLYKTECTRRGKNTNLVDSLVSVYESWKSNTTTLDGLRAQKNTFNDQVIKLSGDEKAQAIVAMKTVSSDISELEKTVGVLKTELDSLTSQIPNLSSTQTPVGKTDADNPVIKEGGSKTEYTFTPKPYYELPVYKQYVDQVTGAKNMGSRGFYLRGQMARFQKVLFDWAEEIILKHGFEYMYVPLMLNAQTLTGTGHYPDFDGQMYEVEIDEGKSYFLIGSSEPSMISYYADKTLGSLTQPLLMTANTTCFRKEAGSYGKDQQGILRVHQFEKIELNAICRPQDNDRLFELHGKINEEIFDLLGLHWRAVEVCTGDMPQKHYRQQDYEAFFPGTQNYREVSSNGSASDYQNRTLGMSYIDDMGTKQVPWGLNCTGITFRTGLAILEQFQQEDGSVKLPNVLADRMGQEFLS
jgi:seryl-tRNA synthetase